MKLVLRLLTLVLMAVSFVSVAISLAPHTVQAQVVTTISIHDSHIGATNEAFQEEEDCPAGTSDYGWHFVLPGNDSEFVSLTVTYQNDGVITDFISRPTAKHAYQYTSGPDTLVSATAEITGTATRFNLSHVCVPENTPDDPGDPENPENPGDPQTPEDPSDTDDPITPDDDPETDGDTPTVRHGVSLHNGDIVCNQNEVRVVFDVYNYGSPVNNLLVRFTFNGQTREARTNNDGRAQVTFPMGSGVIVAEAEGYGTYTHQLTPDDKCPTVYLDPDRGQVLGATTLADTGSSTIVLAQVLITGGALLTAAGAHGLRRV
ncbi:MAG TPA: hypothetical protein VF209_03700 [Patescibacteria group bacterium]